MVKNLFRDPATEAVVGLAGLTIVILGIGIGLVVNSGGPFQIFGGGLVLVAVLLLLLTIYVAFQLVTEHGTPGNANRRLSFHFPLRWPVSMEPDIAHLEPQDSANNSLDPQLIQFTNAWLLPAWHQAIEQMIQIRGEVRRTKGELMEALLQQAVMEPGGAAYGRLQTRLQDESDEPLEILIVELYGLYEDLVRWIWRVGASVNLPFSDSQRFQEWQENDGKLLDHLREMVASPDFEGTRLATVNLEAENGAVRKQVRYELTRRPSSGRKGGLG